MGYTSFTVELIERHLDGVKSVVDLGAQNMYNQPVLPAPYASEWYKEKGLAYACIDLNGENDAEIVDLSIDQNWKSINYDVVVDAGTSEHVGKNGTHDIEAFYNCWLNKFNLCKIGGKIISENPKTGNWPGHGFNYVDEGFYYALEVCSDMEIAEIGLQAAMGNTTDGWNVYCVMQKSGDRFPSLEDFKKLGVKTK